MREMAEKEKTFICSKCGGEIKDDIYGTAGFIIRYCKKCDQTQTFNERK